jgi:2-polyprenyl-3-methyl-5-hydroxy-6-metoxy-1,4-benzoquinol methylase
MIDYEKEYFENYYPASLKNFDRQYFRKVKNWFWGWFKILDKFLRLKNGGGRSALEIGCAIGGFSSILAERNFCVTATDVGEDVLSVARKFSPNVIFKKFDALSPIGLSEKFDFIFAFEVIEHLENPLAAIVNLKKMLTSKGVLVCSSPPPYEKFKKIPGHINIKSREEWYDVFCGAGFKKIKIKQYLFLPLLYRRFKVFSIGLPLRLNLPFFNSTYFIIAKQ